MTTLLINDPEPPADDLARSLFGGRPSAPGGTMRWPACRHCKGKMQFLGQLNVPGRETPRLLALFMCQNDPGMCDDWDPDSGANRVVQFDCDNLQLVDPPEQGETTRAIRHGVREHDVAADSYEQACQRWAENSQRSGAMVLGQLGGEPAWLQDDETPDCNECGELMAFIAQLEEGPERRSAMNFGGGGRAYVFRCLCNERSAKMLWQS